MLRKRFGQHLLQDKNIARKIVALAELRPGEQVLEIGPGRGVLTEEIIRLGSQLVAIEIDRDFCSYLKEKFGTDSFRLIEADSLKLDFGKEIFSKTPGRFKVISNLPYYLTTPLLFKLLEWRRHISVMVLTMQLEVARRLVAKPGSKDYGILSLAAQLASRPSLSFRIRPGSFFPPPRVNSAVVRFEIREKNLFPIKNETNFLKMVRTIFNKRRKMLVNTLKDLKDLERDKIISSLEKAGIKPTCRPETLSLEELYRLYKALSGDLCP
jgi:16S rRNA (adenine1518-N6/adenine1519-N6)-dimethyltransferase